MEVIQHHIIEGSGSSKGGSSAPPRSAVEDPNTLQSRATARVLDLISEGECGGLVNGAQSIFFNDTPVQNADGSFNFAGLVWDQRVGGIGQTYMPGFPKQEAEQPGPGELLHNVVKGVTVGPDIDAVRVTLRLPQGLFAQDTTTGDLHGSDVTWQVQTKPASSGSFTTRYIETISGKTMSSYDRSVRIERDGTDAAGWIVQVTRLSGDSTSAAIKNQTFWASYTEIEDHVLAYDNSAYVGVAIDAQSVSSIPTRSYEWKGLLVEVPNNYDPVTREYFGTWNGVFNPIKQYTDNPAWHIYALLTNPRFGLGDFVSSLTVDKYSFYTAAQYNDQLVPDGKGGTEPRFTCSAQIMTRDDAFKVLQSIAAVMRSSLYAGSGIIKIVQDRPGVPVKLITKADIIDKFTYSATPKSARHSACTVTFNDKTNRYLPRTIAEQDDTYVARYQYQSMDIAGFGCTSEGQARRQAKWVIYTDCVNTEGVTFAAGLNLALGVEPGDVVTIMDNDYIGVPFSGKIVAGSTQTSLNLDRTVTLLPGQIYTITILNANAIDLDGASIGSCLETKTVTSPAGEHSVLALAGGFSMVPQVNHPWVLSGEATPRNFKVLSIKETDRGKFQFNCISYDPNKFAYAENGLIVPPAVFSTYGTSVVPPVTGVKFTQESIYKPDGTVHLRLRVNWTAPVGVVIGLMYLFKWRRDNQQYVSVVQPFAQTEYVIEDALHGIYDVIITAVNQIGVTSPAVNETFNMALGVVSPLDPPTGLALSTGGTAWTGTDFTVAWIAPPISTIDLTDSSADFGFAALYDYEVRIFDPSNLVDPLRIDYTTDTKYAYSFDKNVADYGPRRSLVVQVSCRDTFFALSNPVSATFTNAAIPQPTVIPSVTGTNNTVRVIFSLPAGVTDYGNNRVWMSTTSGFTPSNSNYIRDTTGFDFTIPAQPLTTYYVRLALVDTFGPEPFSALNLTSEIPVTTLSSDVTFTAPAANLILNFPTSTVEVLPDGRVRVMMRVTWTPTSDTITGYELGITEGSSSEVVIPLGATSVDPVSGATVAVAGYSFEARPNTVYKIHLRSVNLSAKGQWSDLKTVTSEADTTIPPAPTGLTVSSGFKSIFLNWTNPNVAGVTIPNFSFARIYRAAYQPLIGSAGTGYHVHDVLTLVGGTFTAPATFKVVAVDGAGAIVSFAVLSAGHYTAAPPPSNATTTVVPSGGTGATINNFQVPSGGAMFASTKGDSFTDSALATNSLYYYWVTAVSTSNIESAKNSTLGTGTAPAQIATADYQNLSIVNAQIADLAVDSAKIGDAAITNAKIGALAVTTEKVGSIDASKINVGSNSLSTWQSAGDATQINGGKIAARTITAASIALGNTNIAFNITFSTDYTTDNPSNVVRWSSGNITYNLDAVSPATPTVVSIANGSTTWATGTLYLYWVKDAGTISFTATPATAYGVNNVVLATYTGGPRLIVTFGRTIIDGSSITAGSITASQLSTNELISTSAQIRDLTVTNIKIAGSAVTNDKISTGAVDDRTIDSISASKITAGSVITQLLKIKDDKFTLDGSSQTLTIYDNQTPPKVRVRIGKTSDGDYGIQIYNALGNLVVTPTGLGTGTVGTGQLVPGTAVTGTQTHESIDGHAYYLLVNTDGATRTLSGSGPWDQDNTSAGATIPIWSSSTGSEDTSTDSFTQKVSFTAAGSKSISFTASFDLLNASGGAAQATIPTGSTLYLSMYAKVQIYDTNADPSLTTDLGGAVKLVGTATNTSPFLPGHYTAPAITFVPVAGHVYKIRFKAYFISNSSAGMASAAFMKNLTYDVVEQLS